MTTTLKKRKVWNGLRVPHSVYSVQFGGLGTTTFSADSNPNLHSLPLPESVRLHTDHSLHSLFMSTHLQTSRNTDGLVAGVQERKTKTAITTQAIW